MSVLCRLSQQRVNDMRVVTITMLEQTKLTVLFILSLITPYLCQVQIQLDCTSPNGDAGICIPITDCQPLLNLLQKEDITRRELLLLRESRCGSINNSIMVCCVINDARCYNPDGNLGLCVGVNTCPAITNILKPPLSKEIVEFIRGSRCEGPDKYSVCCSTAHRSQATITGVCEPSPAPPDPRTECCGVDNSSGNKIYGGTEVAIDQYPWLSLIEYSSKKDNRIRLLCGGALISSKYVLTAAHCTIGPVLNTGKPINVRLGEYDVSNDGPDCIEISGGGQDCTIGPVIVPIEKVIPHRDYDPQSSLRRNDIALIRMSRNVEYNDFIRPICLPTSDITQSKQNILLYAAGWGAVSNTQSFSNVKLHVSLEYKPLEQCQQAYNVSGRKLELWNGQMCAGGEAGKDTCRGDSGGPLMYDDGRIYYIVGVINFGPTPCALKGVPGVYAKVYEYIPWIRSNIKP